MLEAKLNPCANLLYGWIQRRGSGESSVKVDLQDFKAWISEYRDRPYSDREIFDALQQLKELAAVGISKTEVTVWVKPREMQGSTEHPSLELLLNECNITAENSRNQHHWNDFLGDRPNRFLTVSLIVLTSFLCGLIPLIAVQTVPETQLAQVETLTPWSVLGENDTY
ncbi:hypothetical protein NG796_18615 [Laspinema sp. A4]|uniref:hypothetical protein n=1 Tax=Laspinema sp. D2d TaxID=2953686 RepID=UPI0021BB8A27|nr:hypothetical protein [Laspinema sp. D2d]MCT7985290.1 hypothetical protein [Laspinema sp. D2d]